MEWQIITVLITLGGGIALIAKPIYNLTKAITELTAICRTLEQQFTSLDAHNHDSHKRLWEHNDSQDSKLNDHEKRIFKLEER